MELIPKVSRFLWNMSCEKCDNHGIWHKWAGGF